MCAVDELLQVLGGAGAGGHRERGRHLVAEAGVERVLLHRHNLYRVVSEIPDPREHRIRKLPVGGDAGVRGRHAHVALVDPHLAGLARLGVLEGVRGGGVVHDPAKVVPCGVALAVPDPRRHAVDRPLRTLHHHPHAASVGHGACAPQDVLGPPEVGLLRGGEVFRRPGGGVVGQGHLGRRRRDRGDGRRRACTVTQEGVDNAVLHRGCGLPRGRHHCRRLSGCGSPRSGRRGPDAPRQRVGSDRGAYGVRVRDPDAPDAELVLDPRVHPALPTVEVPHKRELRGSWRPLHVLHSALAAMEPVALI
mmetsp:Transcript_50162/g.160671  ORF Transcript_50162/g.160671 Transcript_50162/m.160671 type:complete len:306 (+) Transcript_50162:1580-2497(+)